MSLIHYSIAGTTACIAAVAGVFLQITLSKPEPETAPQAEEAKGQEGVRLPQIAVPMYSRERKIGYCVMQVEYGGEHIDPEESQIVVPRVTNDLYIEFGAVLENEADAVADCERRLGLRTDKFVIIESEFYEKINPG